MFRAFWERDECHSLLEKLRVEADEFRVRAEEFRAKAEESRTEAEKEEAAGGGGGEGGGGGDDELGGGGDDELSAMTIPSEEAPGSGFGASCDGEEDLASFHDNDAHVRSAGTCFARGGGGVCGAEGGFAVQVWDWARLAYLCVFEHPGVVAT